MDTELKELMEELQQTGREIGARGAGWDKRIAALERAIEQRKLELKRPVLAPGPDTDAVRSDDNGGFSNLADFVSTIRFNPGDSRLPALHERAMSMGVGAAGGFLVPPQFAEILLSIGAQDAIVRPRATVIPAGESPDASISIPADDQSGAKGVYSGVQVVWTGEGGTKSETEPALRQIELNPHEVSGYTVVTDRLLRNASSASAWLEGKLRAAVFAAEDQAFISGSGVGQPIGFLGHASNINVGRAAPGAIAYADVVNMFWQLLKRQGSAVWIGSPSTLPQLMTMASALGQLVWQPSARAGIPPTLLGIPFLENERQPVLGTAGDLMLVNLSHYVIKDGAAMAIDASQHVRFKNNETVIRVVWNVDGQPTLNTPLLLEDGVSQQSPFVVLQ